MKKFALALASLLFAAPALSAGPIEVAASLSLTGKYAEPGIMIERAYRLWERDVNARGGLIGLPVRLKIVDDKSDPVLARELYQDFMVKQKVDFVFGPYSSEITNAVAELAEQYRYPLLASGASGDSLWRQGRKQLFGIYVTSHRYTTGFLELLLRNRINKIALLSAEDPFSKSIEQGALEWAKRFEIEVLYSGSLRRDGGDMTDQVRRAKESGAQALVVAGYFNESVAATHALKTVGWKPQAFYATVGPALDKFQEVLKSDADLTYSSSQWEPNLPFPGAKDFNERFYAAYGTAPSYHAASGYSAGQILEAAVKKTGGLDRAKLRDTLSSLDALTVIGRYGVDRDGRQVRHFTTTVQWQNGKKVIVAPDEMAAKKPLFR